MVVAGGELGVLWLVGGVAPPLAEEDGGEMVRDRRYSPVSGVSQSP